MFHARGAPSAFSVVVKLQVAAVLMALSASFTGCVVEANGVEPPEATEKDREASKKAAYVEAIQPSELAFPLGKASIRSLNSHLDDPTFEAKWSSLTKSPVDFFGGTSSSYFADIATLEPTRYRDAKCCVTEMPSSTTLAGRESIIAAFSPIMTSMMRAIAQWRPMPSAIWLLGRTSLDQPRCHVARSSTLYALNRLSWPRGIEKRGAS